MDNNLCVFLLFHCRSWKLPSTFVSVSFSDPCWMNTRLFLVAGADGRDWICVTGESAQLLPVAAACQTAAVCLSLAQTHTLTHSHSLTNSQSRIQSHSFKNINAYTPTQPFTPNNQLCSDAQLKEHMLRHFFYCYYFSWNSTETHITVCIYILCIFN